MCDPLFSVRMYYSKTPYTTVEDTCEAHSLVLWVDIVVDRNTQDKGGSLREVSEPAIL